MSREKTRGEPGHPRRVAEDPPARRVDEGDARDVQGPDARPTSLRTETRPDPKVRKGNPKMSRIHGLGLVALAGLALTMGSVGCAHCDTCDDFPAPCTGPNCGYPYNHGGDVYAGAPAPASADASMSAPAAPAPSSVSSTPAPGASLGPASDAAPKPAPDLPAVNPEKK